jgi:OMF family outer membrane factor
LAKYQTYYAKINRFSPRANIGYAMTDNLQLPVNFLPAEVFGGPAGTFKEAKFGQQYIQNLNITPQIDLINHAAWAKLESVKTSELLSDINNKLVRKTLSESVVAVYFNIVSFQEQIKILNKTLQNADSVTQIVQQKHNQGIIRSQDVNNARVNKLMIQDRIQQLQNGIEQQYNLLKSLCDVPVSTKILIENQNSNSIENTTIANFTILDFNNLVGDPVNKYRKSYKGLDQLRSLFFQKVQNEPDLDKYLDFYKWFDSALGSFLIQLTPASADTSNGLLNVSIDFINSSLNSINFFKSVNVKLKDPLGVDN